MCDSGAVSSRPATASGALLALALALAGCATATPGPGSTPTPDDVIESSRTSATAPAAFLDRDELASCGEVELTQGESIPDEAYDCMDAAFATGAELVVLAPTTEGDPIVTYYRVGPGIDGMEYFIDSTLDQYGFGWAQLRCPGTTTLREPQACEEVG